MTARTPTSLKTLPILLAALALLAVLFVHDAPATQASSHPTLTGLTISDSAGAVFLTPAFAAATTSYTASSEASSVTVSATWAGLNSAHLGSFSPDKQTSYTGSASFFASGGSAMLNLAPSGPTLIELNIRQDGTNAETRYTITVTKKYISAPGKPTGVTLATQTDGSLRVSWTAATGMLSGTIPVEGHRDMALSGYRVQYRNVENTNADGTPAWRDTDNAYTLGRSVTIPADEIAQTRNDWGKPNSRYVARVRAWNYGLWKVGQTPGINYT